MIFTLLCIIYFALNFQEKFFANAMSQLKEEIMSQFIHYFVLIFIVFICAEIRNVLLYDTPFQSSPVAIWNESTTGGTTQEGVSVGNIQ
jgi:hypothetical protein